MPGEKILIVEDNAMNMELAQILLEESGYEALCATSAESGIEIAQAELPRVILMDVSLPGMGGLEAVSALKANPATSAIPIVVMTAHAMRGDEAKALDAGCDSYLTKPINTREFLQVVAGYVRSASPGTDDRGSESGTSV